MHHITINYHSFFSFGYNFLLPYCPARWQITSGVVNKWIFFIVQIRACLCEFNAQFPSCNLNLRFSQLPLFLRVCKKMQHCSWVHLTWRYYNNIKYWSRHYLFPGFLFWMMTHPLKIRQKTRFFWKQAWQKCDSPFQPENVPLPNCFFGETYMLKVSLRIRWPLTCFEKNGNSIFGLK